MSVIFKQGDMFAQAADAIVNTVNCVGVMGKGVALEFKKRWPENFAEYKRLCDRKVLRPGKVFVYDNIDMLSADSWRFLVNFPTKDHWRGKSQIGYIDDGLDDFLAQVRKLDIKSVVLPPLGCGNGGLEWDEVKQLLIEKLSFVDDVEFLVFEPAAAGRASGGVDMEMNFERAVLVKALGDLTDYFGGGLTRIVMQKIVYFLQAMGVDYRMAFSRNEFGPYSTELKAVFLAMEKKNAIAGFSSDTRETTVTSEAYRLADDFLVGEERDRAQAYIKRASLLFEGYESPYGMELLSSVHFLADHEKVADIAGIENALSSWNSQKGEKFGPELVSIAYGRLREDRMIN